MNKRVGVSIVMAVVAAVGLEGAAVKPPPWLAAEAARPAPSLPPETEAVVLLDDQSTVVSPNGVMTTTCRRAARVLRPGGVESARRLLLVDTYNIKVRSMTGWVINPDGSPREVTMKQVISSSVVPDTLYMDAKVLMLVVPEVDVGSVVGFESVQESTPEALEDSCALQGEFPVVRATYSIVLPPRWEPEFSWVNWATLEPRHNADPRSPRRLVLRDPRRPGHCRRALHAEGARPGRPPACEDQACRLRRRPPFLLRLG